MSYIAVRGGHNNKSTGANGLINEVAEDRKVKDAVIKYLKSAGHKVIDVTSPDSYSTQSTDLSYGVTKANNEKVDLFISVHFNNAYKTYTGAIGHECLIYGPGGQAEPIAKRIVSKVCSTGLKNRGVKNRPELYELKNTKMPSIIIEVCFVEATDDIAIYRKMGPDAIGKLIAEAIHNKPITTPEAPKPETNKKVMYRVCVGSYSEKNNAISQQEKLKKAGFDSFLVAYTE